ncbi:3-oxoadipate enol-lactonase [Pelagibacterium sediminicola]|uniref:3-oxoadipate enol-lactonase n=1 Tax=Pelagibacterium sediminicola TaxID=2248761 RepID=UPI000E31CAAC|nr:3-oxoadipate enol-lactonase [Pelagibacterium sediminicola]
MQSAQIGDIAIHYRFAPPKGAAPVIVFINSLGTDFRIWDDVLARLDETAGTLTYDKRGHGLSGIGATPYTIAGHAADLAGLMDHLGISGAIVCGLSVGGQVAQELYFSRPDLVSGLLISNSAAKIGEPDFWRQRIALIAEKGLAATTDGIMERWFSPGFRTPENPAYQLARAMFERQPVEGYLATCEAIAAYDRRADTPAIAVPTAVIVGEHDGSTPPALVGDFAAAIPGAVFSVIEGAGHIPCMETPGPVAEALAALARRVSKGE